VYVGFILYDTISQFVNTFLIPTVSPNAVYQKIPVAAPWLDECEEEFVQKAMSAGAISGFFGEYIQRFEHEFSNYSGCHYGVAVSNGTTALQIALAALGIGPGDEVLTATLTNMATFFAVLHQGATPIPVDIEPDTFNLDPNQLEHLLTPRTRAIIVVHLFGHPVNMGPVIEFARRHDLRVIEDCAEAHGAEYCGKRVGSIGDIGCFSFYANKIITTGEGGMCVTNDAALATEMRSLKSLAFGEHNKFMHRAVGFNFRMTNLQAAIGCAQMQKISEIISRKRLLARFYTENLDDLEFLQLPGEADYSYNVFWMYHIALRGRLASRRGEIIRQLAERGIETREGFIPFNMQEIFLARGLTSVDSCPCANQAAYRTFYLPSGPTLTESQLGYVCENFRDILTNLY
jgi:perosamine synthetase